MFKVIVASAVLLCVVVLVNGHGMVLEPVARMSRWRFDWQAPANYDDNGQFCGGYTVQWQQNGGKCGFCGDNYADKAPRSSELGGGQFGTGVIVKEYSQGGVMPVSIQITANHLGFFFFRLCNLDKYKTESEECFEENKLSVVNGNELYYLNSRLEGFYNTTLQLPAGVKCEHCVFQWTYNTGEISLNYHNSID